MAKHKHGEMDITEQEKTFEGFVKWSMWVAVVSVGLIIFAGLVNG
ncbi:aa3-type cytochrome c oxidase subunit IV [Pseudaestuariivita atlantica]|uniref:Cytochrome C oxidase subunit IV n=1 Tax=Pseudaestuariivita atlantica TaxID=1317121 RepID=A0A0L1JLF2_9RHOB|nr:aa3-type cytochrome c oxidase subunit IV [Pseudaestuariivita atlantica]KNG92579.1 cytochrome C oxidase subunit IV [Pseudaestuariivita atlantica]